MSANRKQGGSQQRKSDTRLPRRLQRAELSHSHASEGTLSSLSLDTSVVDEMTRCITDNASKLSPIKTGRERLRSRSSRVFGDYADSPDSFMDDSRGSAWSGTSILTQLGENLLSLIMPANSCFPTSFGQCRQLDDEVLC